MKQKLEDLLYNVLDFLINNRWASIMLFLWICALISYFILYPINRQLAIGFLSGAILTSIYRYYKKDEN